MGGENGMGYYDWKPEKRRHAINKLFNRKYEWSDVSEIGIWQADWSIDDLFPEPVKIPVKAGNLGTQMGFGTPVIVRVIKRTKIEVSNGS